MGAADLHVREAHKLVSSKAMGAMEPTSGKTIFDILKEWSNADTLLAFAIALGILIVTAIATHLVTKVLRKLLSHENSPLPQSSIFVNIWRICGWAIGISIMLSTCFNFDVSGAVTALGVGGIALSLGLQDTISNLIGGVQMSILGTLVPGDHVEISGRKGLVHDVKWRQVTIETANDQMVIVPNSVINNGALVKLPPAEKIIVPISLYKNVEDLDTWTAEVVKAVKAEVGKVAPVTKEPVVQFTSILEFSYAGNIIVWIDMTDLPYSVTLDAYDAIVRVAAKLSPTI